jgi:hypothetical protein
MTDGELHAIGYAADERGWWRSTDARPVLPGSTETPVEGEVAS